MLFLFSNQTFPLNLPIDLLTSFRSVNLAAKKVQRQNLITAEKQ